MQNAAEQFAVVVSFSSMRFTRDAWKSKRALSMQGVTMGAIGFGLLFFSNLKKQTNKHKFTQELGDLTILPNFTFILKITVYSFEVRN